VAFSGTCVLFKVATNTNTGIRRNVYRRGKISIAFLFTNI
jgi:hypothetical protein